VILLEYNKNSFVIP